MDAYSYSSWYHSLESHSPCRNWYTIPWLSNSVWYNMFHKALQYLMQNINQILKSEKIPHFSTLSGVCVCMCVGGGGGGAFQDLGEKLIVHYNGRHFIIISLLLSCTKRTLPSLPTVKNKHKPAIFHRDEWCSLNCVRPLKPVAVQLESSELLTAV